ncbi:hypothetical protein [Ochrobactrum sp. S1502_03]|uniref:hypothetical protein n=1 Tax=Ochrobactrum sp. S1502_03 TaxID=3108451 RepID=UPI0037CB33D3
MKTLTPEIYDEMTAGIGAGGSPRASGYMTTPKRSTLASEALWGAASIARYMGVSDDFVRKLALRKDAPIRMKAGRYYCTRTEIVVWLNANDPK